MILEQRRGWLRCEWTVFYDSRSKTRMITMWVDSLLWFWNKDEDDYDVSGQSFMILKQRRGWLRCEWTVFYDSETKTRMITMWVDSLLWFWNKDEDDYDVSGQSFMILKQRRGWLRCEWTVFYDSKQRGGWLRCEWTVFYDSETKTRMITMWVDSLLWFWNKDEDDYDVSGQSFMILKQRRGWLWCEWTVFYDFETINGFYVDVSRF